LINNFIYIIAGAMGVFMGISVGGISSFLMYANHYSKPFNEITTVIGEIQKAIASASRVDEILSKPTLPDVLSLVELQKDASVVEFVDVNFSYDPNRPLIKHFNLSVETGEKIAIVGSTGAGKTTLINLLMRYYDADSGSISINGFDIRSIPYSALRNHISIVMQDSFIKECSVFENIAFGNKNATMDDVVNASKRAMCFDLIERLPNGFDTIVNN
ncbi:MAG: ABC transporter ATP-binding protein, partial [Clostridia bacterium]